METSTQTLINKILNAHGINNAAEFQTVKIHTNIGGAVWGMKGHEKRFKRCTVYRFFKRAEKHMGKYF